MLDEEKKAMKRIDYIQDFIIENGQYNADVGDMQYFSKVLNLIEKQSKEIEILNKNMNLLREQNISYKQSIHGLKEMNKIINKKWEDKIKAKIEESELLIDNSQGCMSNEDSYKEFGKIEFGKSLLEKE